MGEGLEGRRKVAGRETVLYWTDRPRLLRETGIDWIEVERF